MASDQERLAICEEVVGLLSEGRFPKPERKTRILAVMREIRDIYAGFVAKHSAKHAGPAKRNIDSREIAEAMWEDIRR